MSKVIGIDLGTTFSSVAFLNDGKPEIIPDAKGRKSLPSVLVFSEDTVFSGYEALKYELKYPENVVRRVKRKMGTGEKIKINDRTYSPEELSSFILKELKKIAENYLNEKIFEAVITVPAYFNDNQRQATKIAGELAGLKTTRIINEPTAAALAYGMRGNEEQNIVVYDLGGGTFDVSILTVSDGIFEVVATCGDNNLGGEDFNKRIEEIVLERFYKETGIDLKADPLAIAKLGNAIEQAKIELSTKEKTNIYVPFITADENGPKDLDFEITRNEFEEMIVDYVDRTIELCQESLSDAGLTIKEIDRIILVGGSSKIPYIRKRVSEFFKKEADLSVDPEYSVARGAAIQAGIIQGEKEGLILVDVIPLSLGIEVENRYFVPIIERNTPIPTCAKRIFTTVTDFQKSVEIHILQGESMYAKNNVSLGKFKLEGIREAKKGVPRIEVIFEIDVNGILSVSAVDVDTKITQNITIKNESFLTKDEVDKLQKDKRLKAEIDRRKSLFEVMKLKTYAENLMDRIKTTLPPLYYNMLVNQELEEIKFSVMRNEEEQNLDDLKRQIDRLEFILSEISTDKNFYQEVV
ncbi:MAG: Hsp70 family protein [Brevinematia bacterium]